MSSSRDDFGIAVRSALLQKGNRQKFYLFFSAVNGGLYLAVFVAIVTNVVGAFYYIRCIKLAYFDGSKE